MKFNSPTKPPERRDGMEPAMVWEIAVTGIRLLDDAYMAWEAAEFEAEQALHDWFEGAGGQRMAAYYAYLAAADREEAAAHDLRRLHELTRVCAETLAAG